jgi:predicted Zn-ribbon and HTH transcriptional regulator
MQCLQCDKKIGWLKKPVDGSYCSEECRAAAMEEMRWREQETLARLEAEELSRERERLEIEAAMLRQQSEVVRRPSLAQNSDCPKCSAPWRHVHGGGKLGRDRGECSSCGFQAEFLGIEQCPNCRCISLLVESQDDARCPRCKSRPRRRRQIA